MAPKLFYTELSPPARSTLLTAQAIGLDLDLKNVDLSVGEHMAPEYLKMNPQHTVPTLDDNGYFLWDSHAINMYLVGKYAKDDSLYPRDPQKRGIVDQRLFFCASVVQARLAAIVGPILRQGEKTIAQEKIDNVHIAYDLLEIFLGDHDYVAGDSLTIADLSIVAHLASLSGLIPIAQNKYRRLSKWMHRMQQLPYYEEANQVGSDKLVGFLQSKLV
ncbi:hypothetical protein PPYR_10189 [Photinus pyralis]|uniref:Uncharacterized protein n=2 Tax=Photinus pyralis TaxID=7054 RepID=A0A5N4AFX1_PHOPY|nr:glutathione S-transferase 1-like [Photinus pyralis]KAB0796128.1 hypothetical protein PPYR_10189 [Photinus pyralis]